MPNISSKQIQWVLDKALPGIVLSKQSITLDSDNLTDTFTITTNSDGNLSVSSSDDSITTVSLSGNTVTVTAVANGPCTITVNVDASADGNYSSNSIALSVTCNLTQPLVNYTPEQIQSIVNEGKAAATWSIGDTTATITMNGNVSAGLTLNNYQCKAILIGIDHNTEKETGGKSSAHFILSKDTSNNEIAFCDWAGTGDNGGDKTSGTWFNHNNSLSNYGGWKSSNLRNTILPKFKSALPSAWQNILGTVTKYSDNVGYKSQNNTVSATSDQLFLLAEWEVFGKRDRANNYEQNYQQQYTYFANGNSKVMKNNRATGSSVNWWLRSTWCSFSDYFALVYTSGYVGHGPVNRASGVVPGFAIIQS